MSTPVTWYKTLFGRTTILLAITLFLFQALSFAISAYYVGLPLAQRAATDLATLMVSATKDKNRLPKDQQVDFLTTLQDTHELRFYGKAMGALQPYSSQLPYFKFLTEALQQLTGNPVVLYSSHYDDTWFWFELKNTPNKDVIGFSETRVGAKPRLIILPAILIILTLSLISSIFLAGYLTRPIHRLASATQRVASGELPEPLAESGPEELALLSRNFNVMAKQVNNLLANRTILLAGVSHDLRTPLTRMALSLEMLGEKYDPELVKYLRADVADMENLIGQFLGFARGIHPGVIQTNTDVNALIQTWVSDARRSGAKITLNENSKSLLIPVDVTALHRVFMNLLENAVRYSSGESVEVVLNESNVDNTCIIAINDHGPGIPADKIEEVFQPFYRIESSRNDETGGSGLGLSIAREICRANKWDLLLTPREGGVGISAQINLPC